jgi:hypothetical protein
VTAAAVLARAQAAGVRLRLTAGGTVEVEADAPPPREVLDELRRWRVEVADLLAEQAITGGLVGNDSEREAMAAHYAESARGAVVET